MVNLASATVDLCLLCSLAASFCIVLAEKFCSDLRPKIDSDRGKINSEKFEIKKEGVKINSVAIFAHGMACRNQSVPGRD